MESEYINRRLNGKSRGPRYLLAQLLKSGVDREVAETALQENFCPETEQKLVLHSLQQLNRQEGMTAARLARALYNRGFSGDAIK